MTAIHTTPYRGAPLLISSRPVDVEQKKLISLSPTEGDRMRTRRAWFFIQQHNKQHMLLQALQEGAEHQLNQLNMSKGDAHFHCYASF